MAAPEVSARITCWIYPFRLKSAGLFEYLSTPSPGIAWMPGIWLGRTQKETFSRESCDRSALWAWTNLVLFAASALAESWPSKTSEQQQQQQPNTRSFGRESAAHLGRFVEPPPTTTTTRTGWTTTTTRTGWTTSSSSTASPGLKRCRNYDGYSIESSPDVTPKLPPGVYGKRNPKRQKCWTTPSPPSNLIQ